MSDNYFKELEEYRQRGVAIEARAITPQELLKRLARFGRRIGCDYTKFLSDEQELGI